MLRWAVLPMAVFAYLAVTVSAATPRDRDHDRLPDRWERNHQLSTTIPSAKRDPDRDHLNNFRELRLRTHPRLADTDRDRLHDGAEVRRFHTNPRRWDTDGDRFSDRCELRKGTNPRKRRSHPKHPCSRSPQTAPTDPAPPPGPQPVACAPTSPPGPISGEGYSERFSDCFDTLNRTVWCSNQWWEPNPPPGSQYVENGVLHVVSRRSDGYPNNTISSEPCGQSNPKSFKQGYFEARFRSTNGRGSMPAFWLFSTRHAANPAWPDINPYCAQNGLPQAECLVSELDIQEGHDGVYPFPRGSQIFAGTLHRNTSGFYGGGEDQFRQVFVDTHPINYGGNYHVYSAKWTLTEVCWYLDEVKQGCQPAYDSTNQPMHIMFYQWPNSWNELKPDSTTPDELHIEVDWVRVWQQSG